MITLKKRTAFLILFFFLLLIPYNHAKADENVKINIIKNNLSDRTDYFSFKNLKGDEKIRIGFELINSTDSKKQIEYKTLDALSNAFGPINYTDQANPYSEILDKNYSFSKITNKKGNITLNAKETKRLFLDLTIADFKKGTTLGAVQFNIANEKDEQTKYFYIYAVLIEKENKKIEIDTLEIKNSKLVLNNNSIKMRTEIFNKEAKIKKNYIIDATFLDENNTVIDSLKSQNVNFSPNTSLIFEIDAPANFEFFNLQIYNENKVEIENKKMVYTEIEKNYTEVNDEKVENNNDVIEHTTIPNTDNDSRTNISKNNSNTLFLASFVLIFIISIFVIMIIISKKNKKEKEEQK